MKEFNLKKCIAGKPVVTRDGRAYKFGAYNPHAKIYDKVTGWIDGEVCCHSEKGKYYPDNESPYDLFMATETVDGWVNVYSYENFYSFSVVYNSEQEAKENVMSECIATVKIQFQI